MGVFAMLATGIIVASISNYKLSYENSYRSSAHDIAQGYLNQIRKKPFSSLEAFAADNNNTISLTKVETLDGSTGNVNTFDVNNGTLFTELVFIGDIGRDGGMSNKSMTMDLTFNVVDVSAATGLKVVEINLNYSFTYNLPGWPGGRTFTDSRQIVRAE